MSLYSVSTNQALTLLEREIKRRQTFVGSITPSAKYPNGAIKITRLNQSSIVAIYAGQPQVVRSGDFGR